MDSADRENECDLIVSAQHCTTEMMAFTLSYGGIAEKMAAGFAGPHRRVYSAAGIPHKHSTQDC